MLPLPIGLMASAPALLLDALAVTVKGAYSFRQLRTAYAGASVRVRRGSDNAQQDFGFVGGVLDTAALLAFCGGASGFVVTWYDQSGLGQDAAQAVDARQPRIVNTGALVTLANARARPSATYINAQSWFLRRAGFDFGGAASVTSAATVASRTGNGYQRLLGYTDAGQTQDQGNNNSCVYYLITSGVLEGYAANGDKSGVAVGTNPFQATSHYNGSSHTMRVDGVAGTAVGASPVLTSGALAIGTNNAATGNVEPWDGTVSEVIVMSGTLSTADRTTIEASQKAYWGTP